MLKFVPLLLIGLIGLFYMHSGNFTPFDPHHVAWSGHWHAISFAATLTLWAFLGLESATVPAEEVKDPGAHAAARDDVRHRRDDGCSTCSPPSRSWA